MKSITLRDRLKYRLDNFMAKGTGALVLALVIFSVAIIVIASLIVMALNMGPEGEGFGQLVWRNLMRVVDAGALGEDEGGWFFLILMLLVTAGGIFIFSTLIGVLTTGLEAKLEQLRKGRSFVAETGHTVILGWSPQIFSVVSELVLANESRKKACVAILADKDKVEMEDELRDKLGSTGCTKLVCRTGDPIDLDDLAIVNPGAARSVIVLPGAGENDDSSVLKSVLALNSILDPDSKLPHLTAVVRDSRIIPAARIAGGSRTVFIKAVEVIARIMAQTSRQSGLSVVATDLLDYSGDEIYFHHEPALAGKSFKQAALAYDKSAVLGIRRASGQILLNPTMDATLDQSDSLVCLAEDEDRIKLTGDATASVDESCISPGQIEKPGPERTLILGWNELGPPLAMNLDGYVAPGSEVMIAAGGINCGDALAQILTNLKPFCLDVDISDPGFIEQLDVTGVDQVIVLSEKGLSANKADAKTLMVLLHLRRLADEKGVNFPIVTEIHDRRTQTLAQTTRADDFIVSDRLLSLMLAQISENPELSLVFDELFSPHGAEFYLKPVELYVKTGAAMTFHTLVEAAARRNETAVGYRLGAKATDPEANFGVRLNPRKSEQITLSLGDSLIVLAEDAG